MKAILATLLYALLAVSPLAGQSADSARVQAIRTQTDSLIAETCRGGTLRANGTCSGRRLSPRTTVIYRLATRIDSIEQAALAQAPPVVVDPVPPADTQPTPPPPPPVDTQPVPPPPPPVDTTAIGKILAVIGPTKTVTETAALGGVFLGYEQTFTRYLPPPATDTSWGNNYYDRGVVFYARFARSGDATFRARADTLVLRYRKEYIEKNNYGTSPHWSQIRGLELHYRLTGDTMSRRAVAGMAVGLAGGNYVTNYIGNTAHSNSDNRIQARVLQAALAAYRLNASFRRYDGLTIQAAEWPTRLRDILNRILGTQNADGSWSWAQICGGQLNYMVGMLNDVLIEYYRNFEQDPRIPVVVEKANEYLWATQWLSASGAFKYASVQCTPNPWGVNVGGPSPAPDLNGLLIASFGWLYERTGDAKWRTRGDAIMAGLISTTNYTGSKQFNQGFAESYRYLGWR